MLRTASHLRHAQQIHAGACAPRMLRLSCIRTREAPRYRTRPAENPLCGNAVHEHVHVICIILQLRSAGRCYPMTSRPACASPSSGVARDGMPSRFLTASHCVSHLLLHSACVMRMCCGVGLSMWQVYLTTPPTSTTSLEYSILYELRRHHRRHGSHLVHVIFIVHYVPAGSHTARTPHTAMPPKNRKSRQRMFAS
jgi:hypothetical protein